jgi:predicted acyltransferase
MKKNQQTPTRLLSLDALRGFDMFWIIGGSLFMHSLSKATGWKWANWFSEQMHHVKWEGFHAYDLVFPLFMFMAGVAIPYAIIGKMQKGVAKKSLYYKVVKRAVILVLLGLVYNGVLDFNWGEFRYASVLGQIGLAYMGAALVVLNTRTFKARLIWTVGLLLGVALVHLLIPVPGVGVPQLTPEFSINGYVDQLLLPGQLYRTTYDPEGWLCILSAVAIVLMGTLAGEVIRSRKFKQLQQVTIIGGAGIGLVLLALLIAPIYPIIKSTWTSTFNLLTGGLSLLLLALFYLVIDVWGWKKWTFFFRVIGMNSITIYLAVRMINFKHTSDFLFHGIAGITGSLEPVITVGGIIALEWLVLYILYRNNLFLKV